MYMGHYNNNVIVVVVVDELSERIFCYRVLCCYILILLSY